MKLRIRRHLKAHYGLYMLITNAMVAIGAAAFAILGLLSSMVSVPVLVVNAVVFGILIGVGRFGNEQLEDLPRVCQMEGNCD